MKIYTLIISFFITFFSLNSQNLMDTVVNVHCETATLLCNKNIQSYHYSENQFGGNCSNGISDKVFYYRIESLTNVVFLLDIASNGNNFNSGKYTTYGPFENFDFTICELVSSNANQNSEISFTGSSGPINLATAGNYIIKVTTEACEASITFTPRTLILCNDKIERCWNCIPTFSPEPGRYIVSAWVKQSDHDPMMIYYHKARIEATIDNSSSISFFPVGRIIDGWQKVEGELVIPIGASSLALDLKADVLSYYDDLRIHPIDASMSGYVYDFKTQRLMAELDERNYATLYEYDEEGRMLRIKKETERGIMTIQENRINTVKE